MDESLIVWETEYPLKGGNLQWYINIKKSDKKTNIKYSISWWEFIYSAPLMKGDKIIGYKHSKAYVKWYAWPLLVIGGGLL